VTPASIQEDKRERDEPCVFVTVGTDHHPFDRLVSWVDEWLATDERARARCFVQSGTSAPPRLAEGKAYLSRKEMDELLDLALVVVCHGGPSTIAECHGHGKKPIVVPRRHALSEHVDDHQVRFARHLARLGYVVLVETQKEFADKVSAALTSSALRIAPMRERISDTVKRFAALADPLLDIP
jgi:UDP-N-acetylglucosamine transferase subunit ALG13